MKTVVQFLIINDIMRNSFSHIEKKFFRHENGFVNFWSTGSINMSHLFSVNTTKEFAGCFLGDELKETQSIFY